MEKIFLNGEIAQQLQGYILPEGVLPAIGERRLFASLSLAVLESAVAFTRDFPESRGSMAHIINHIIGREPPTYQDDTVTMEAHLDATALPPHIADAAVALGFGPDPFAQFNPVHYTDHYTLKFKIPVSQAERRKELSRILQQKCEALFALTEADIELKEAYIELEVYHNALNRRCWKNALGIMGTIDTIMPAWSLSSINPPRTMDDAVRLNVPLDIAKQADIHVKLAGGIDRYPLIEHLCEKGFYHVRTGAGNDVLTAQFSEARDAKYIFASLEQFFDRYGGCTEMTLEPVRGMWRTSRSDKTGVRRLAPLPPLVLKIENATRLYEAAAMTERN